MSNGKDKIAFTRQDAERLRGCEDGIKNLNEKSDTNTATLTKAIEQTGEIIKMAIKPLADQQLICQKYNIPQITKNKTWITTLKWVIAGSGGIISIVLGILAYMGKL